MTSQLFVGIVGLACVIAGITLGTGRWLSASLLGIGLGASTYALLLLLTKDPFAFVLDFVSRAIG